MEFNISRARISLNKQWKIYSERVINEAKWNMNVFLTTLQEEVLKPMLIDF